MKKHLSILFTAIFASIIVISSVTSCVTKEDVSINSKNLIGTWKSVSMSGPFMGVEEDDTNWEFKKNGTCVVNGIVLGTWRLSGATLMFGGELAESSDLPLIFTVFELTKDSMTLIYGSGLMTWEFKRVS